MNTRSIKMLLALTLSLSAPMFFAQGAQAAQSMEQGGHDMSQMNNASGSHNAEHAADQTFTAKGTIVSIDKAAKKIVIKHSPVPALGWPEMTMGFAVADPSLLGEVKPGDAVRFDFRNQGNISTIEDIETR